MYRSGKFKLANKAIIIYKGVRNFDCLFYETKRQPVRLPFRVAGGFNPRRCAAAPVGHGGKDSPARLTLPPFGRPDGLRISLAGEFRVQNPPFCTPRQGKTTIGVQNGAFLHPGGEKTGSREQKGALVCPGGSHMRCDLANLRLYRLIISGFDYLCLG